MRFRFLAALGLALSGPAAAAPFTGTLAVYVFGKEQALPAVLSGGGSGVSASALVTLPGGVFTGSAVATTPTIAAPPVTAALALVALGRRRPGSR